MATHSSNFVWETPMDRGGWRATIHRVTRVTHYSATKLPPPPPPTTLGYCRIFFIDCQLLAFALWGEWGSHRPCCMLYFTLLLAGPCDPPSQLSVLCSPGLHAFAQTVHPPGNDSMHSIKIPLILQAQLKFSLPVAASLLLLTRNNYPWNFRIKNDLNTCICMAESLCCPPEAITTLLIDCTPI